MRGPFASCTGASPLTIRATRSARNRTSRETLDRPQLDGGQARRDPGADHLVQAQLLDVLVEVREPDQPRCPGWFPVRIADVLDPIEDIAACGVGERRGVPDELLPLLVRASGKFLLVVERAPLARTRCGERVDVLLRDRVDGLVDHLRPGVPVSARGDLPCQLLDRTRAMGRETSGPRGNRTPVCDVRGRRPNR